MPPAPHLRLPVVDSDPERAGSVVTLIREAGDGVDPVVVDAARDVPPGRFPVAAVSLAAEDPISEARHLSRERGCTWIVFYGTQAEERVWANRLGYEPYLPRHRLIVPVHDAGALRGALTRAFRSARRNEVARPALEQVGRESADLRGSMEQILLDALAPPRGLRDTYAAVFRGALSGMGEGEEGTSGEDARRAVQSALRRIELLRGVDERDRVARSLSDILDRAASRGVVTVSRRLASARDLPDLRTALAEFADAAGLDEGGAAALTRTVIALVDADVRRGIGGVLEAGYAPGRGEVTLTWTDDASRSAHLTFNAPRRARGDVTAGGGAA